MDLENTNTWIDRNCPICGTKDSSVIWAKSSFDPTKMDGFAFASRKLPEYMHPQMLLCKRCDLLYSSPVPDQSTVAAAYADASFDSGAEARYASETYAKIVLDMARQLVDRNSALDIGTGDGAFLERLLELNFDRVMGVEPSLAPIKAAAELVRSRIKHGIFRSEDFEPESFSLVTCFQTIEHLHDPLAFCRSAYDILKPNGALLLVGHNRSAWTNRAMGTRSPIFDIEHMQLFSPASARVLMERAGFNHVHVRSVVNEYPVRYLARLAPLPVKMKPSLIKTLDDTGIGPMAVALPLGNIAFYAFKRT